MIFQRWHSLCHRFIQRYALRAVLFWLCCLPCLSLWAEIPASGTTLPLYGGTGSYRLDYVDHGWRLSIRSDYLTSPIQHDLSDCRFCAAESVGDESDNCQMDGVFPLEFDQLNGVGVVCHVGAHSQRLLLFDSVAPNPKRVLTGSYYLSLALTSGGFEVTYDQLNHQGEPYEQNEMFAATAALKNTGQWLHLNSLSRPQRIGPGEFAPIVAWVGSESLQLFKDPGMDGWWRVQRQNGTQGYLSVVDLPEYINEERK